MFISRGKLKYFDSPLKLIVEVDQELSDYYRSLVPPYVRINQQMYPAHISVVRKEEPPNMQHWGKYQNAEIEFQYDNFIFNSEVYYWLNVFCTRLEEIRVELGLPVHSHLTRPPDGQRVFHTTIGNTKKI